MERLRLLMSFNCPQNVLLTGTRFERRQLMRRAIGRNQLAKDTKADIVWFADCDMTFGEGTFERIVEIFNVDEGAKRPALIFPRNISATEQWYGDQLVEFATEINGPPIVPWSDGKGFVPFSYNRAIGGVQIVPGDIAREHGYVPDSDRYQKPSDVWRRTFEDMHYRKQLHRLYGSGKGTGCQIPNIGRIRHSERGREVEGLKL